MGLFTLWELANATNWGFPPSRELIIKRETGTGRRASWDRYDQGAWNNGGMKGRIQTEQKTLKDTWKKSENWLSGQHPSMKDQSKWVKEGQLEQNLDRFI